MMDLTSLHSNDTVGSIEALVQKVNGLEERFPQYPLPASICVYPNFAGVVKRVRKNPEVHITTVASCFPSTQSFLEVKVRECELAVESGADEVDIVLALGHFLSGNYDEAAREIRRMRDAIDAVAATQDRKVILKAILETGILARRDLIEKASFLAMEQGADFIKTSTGKVDVNATPEAADTMCRCIKKYYEETGRKVGFKAAGGISTAEDALQYYDIGASVLGESWMNRNFFRFGVSRLGNNLMSAVEGTEIKYF